MQFSERLAQRRNKWRVSIAIACVMTIVIAVFYLLVGSVMISPFEPLSGLEQKLIFELRLPRLLAALAIGAALAVSGAVLQVLLSNVLAEPSVLGISGGASVAMVILIFTFPLLVSPFAMMAAAMMGALVFTFLLVTIAKTMHLSTTKLLLVGVALGILSGAVVTWAFYYSDDLGMRLLMYWLMGSVSGVNWSQILILLVMVLPLLWLLVQGNVLDKLMLGAMHARQLGVDANKIRWKLILAVSILIGGTVALGGVISFVGLVVPHILRLGLGSENRYLLPLSALTGACVLALADTIARVGFGATELPLGVVTTTIGAPIFIWMLVKNHDVC